MGLTTTRALVLARGLGTRMRSVDSGAALTAAQQRAADAGLKALMPIAGRPFLDYLLTALADAGIRSVGVVVAPQHETLAAHYAAHPPQRVALSLIVQREALGTADAVLAAEAWTSDEPFLAMNGDNLYPVAVLTSLAALDEPGLAAFETEDLCRTGNIPPERIGAFALIDIDAAGYLRDIVEKPDTRKSDAGIVLAGTTAVSMNCWRFDARIFAACRDVPRSARGEYELPEAVALAARRGVRFRAVPARGPVLDLSRRADALDVERRLAGLLPRP